MNFGDLAPIVNVFKSTTLHVDVGGKYWALFSVYDYHLCQRLADHLSTHKDYRFKKGDEAMFQVPMQSLAPVLAICNIERLAHKVVHLCVKEG